MVHFITVFQDLCKGVVINISCKCIDKRPILIGSLKHMIHKITNVLLCNHQSFPSGKYDLIAGGWR